MAYEIVVKQRKFFGGEKKLANYRLPIKLLQQFKIEAELLGFSQAELLTEILNSWLVNQEHVRKLENKEISYE